MTAWSQEISQVPARPLCTLALFSDPGGTRASGHIDALVLPRFPELAWLPQALYVSGLDHTAFVLAVYASR